MFIALNQFIGIYTDNQIIAVFFRPIDKIQMPDMKDILNTLCVPDFILLHYGQNPLCSDVLVLLRYRGA